MPVVGNDESCITCYCTINKLVVFRVIFYHVPIEINTNKSYILCVNNYL